MPRIYVTRRGHVGASTGCLVFLFLLPFLAIYLVVIGVVLTPAAIGLTAALLGVVGDGLLRVVPSYRRHRREVRLFWPRATAQWSEGLIYSVIDRGNARRRAPVRPARAPAPKLPQPEPPAVDLAAFGRRVVDLFTAAGWTDLALDGAQMVKGRGPDGAFTVIVCDAKAPGQIVNHATVEVCAKMPATTGVDRAILVTHGRFSAASADLALRANLALMDGAALARLESGTATSAAS